jgi:hypothetical protein
MAMGWFGHDFVMFGRPLVGHGFFWPWSLLVIGWNLHGLGLQWDGLALF